MDGVVGVLLLAYGSPGSADKIPAYYTHIRGGRVPSEKEISRLAERYERIGGSSPLLRITMEEAKGLESKLNESPENRFRVYVGMKHAEPFIEDTVAMMNKDGISRAVAIVLAPHYSKMSIGEYFRRVDEADKAGGSKISFVFVDEWHLQKTFVDAVAQNVRSKMAEFGEGKGFVIFTAHSLPARLKREGDPYEKQLLESCAAVANLAKIGEWRLAYQSIPHGASDWLGPDVRTAIIEESDAGRKKILICPIGFVSDHLEILYDIDIECTELAQSRGVALKRTGSLNSSPLLIRSLSEIVRQEIGDQD
ncbi:MAG: ferrochelatase [Candidatus Micrarchaeota archaeon]|nr:ferrochelatase [Candidatus Micrarchaeota archaeon]